VAGVVERDEDEAAPFGLDDIDGGRILPDPPEMLEAEAERGRG